LFSGFVTIGRYGKWLTDVKLLFILIRQMVALVRHTLAKVCTVPVLLGFVSVNVLYLVYELITSGQSNLT